MSGEPPYDAQLEWRKKIDDGVGMNPAQVWLVSFTDLFSILLCFFILMFAMKDPDMSAISKFIGGGGSGGYAGHGLQHAGGDMRGANIKRVSYAQGLDLSYLQSVIGSSLGSAGLADAVEVEAHNTFLSLRLKPEADVGPSARALGRALNGLSNTIKVVGVPAGWSVGDWNSALASAGAFAAQMRAGGYGKVLNVTSLGRNPEAEAAGYVVLYIEGYAE